MNNRLKYIGIGLMAFLLMATACSSGGGKGGSNTPATAEPSAQAGTNNAEPTAPAEPAKIRMFASDQSLPPIASDDKNIKYMEEKTNTDLDLVLLPHAQYADQLKLKFASGDFPDLYQSWSGPEADLVQAGKILELNELIDQYAPNLKRMVTQEMWDAVSLKGRILAIPQPSVQSNSVMYVRKDWLDKLGLQVPTTSDELMTVLKAFRDNDPNGNGKKDEIPFSMREKFSWGDNIFGMWGVNNSWTESYYNGEVILQNIHPNMKQALAYIKTMVDEGVMDSEFLTNSRTVWEQKIKSGLVGMWSHTQQLSWQWQKDLDATIPNENPDVIAIPTPRGAGYDGPVGTRWSPVAKTYIIMKDAKNPEAIIRYIDWLVSEEGQLFTELGQEGDNYTLQDGKIVLDKEKLESYKTMTAVFKMHDQNPLVEEARQDNPRAVEKLAIAKEVGSKEGFVNEAVGMPAVDNNYNITTMFLEAASKIVIGDAPIDHFDAFVDLWRKQGGEQMVKERTEWYNENRKK